MRTVEFEMTPAMRAYLAERSASMGLTVNEFVARLVRADAVGRLSDVAVGDLLFAPSLGLTTEDV